MTSGLLAARWPGDGLPDASEDVSPWGRAGTATVLQLPAILLSTHVRLGYSCIVMFHGVADYRDDSGIIQVIHGPENIQAIPGLYGQAGDDM